MATDADEGSRSPLPYTQSTAGWVLSCSSALRIPGFIEGKGRGDMSDSDGAPAADNAASELSDTINRSIGSVWQRHTGARPDAISTEIGADKVRCVIEGSDDSAPAEEADAEPAADAPVLLTVSAHRNESIESVRRATHRRVVGFISKRDEKAGTSTQTFILDRRLARN